METAKLSLIKLQEPADQLSVLQSENSLIAAQESKQQAEDSLVKSYEDGFNSVTNAYLDLPGVMSGLKDLLYGYGYGDNYANIDWYANQGVALNYNNSVTYDKVLSFRDDVNTSYTKARVAYDQSFADYKTVSRTSDPAVIEKIIMQAYDTTRLIADAIKNTNNYLDLVQDLMQNYSSKITIPSLMTTHQSSLDSYTSKTNTQLTNLLSIKNTIENYKKSIISTDRSIAEKTESLAQLKAGTDALDLRSAQLSVRQKENALASARETVANYSVRAPFDGVVAALSAKKGDTLSSGASAGTLITKQKIATISLNEVDAAKVKVGQRVNITFDAIDNLEITGEVVEMDSLGTVSQGVVSYNVKIAFDVQDERIKPGMSVSANIILDSKNDVLMVSNSAVKTQGGSSYVEVLVNNLPQKKNVTVGKTNDLTTEIVEGLT
ncbi:MAG: efflux RND transporter periplasmic adaptor subunit, partial [Candidatus Magasanikbacteria bacterium]|nr:efflux RND transporter periplasmic adaptor subunit [Candidatus Magasanikbacteria bacterium]